MLLLVLLMFFFFFLFDIMGMKSAFSKAASMIRNDQELALLQQSFSGVFAMKFFTSLLGILFSVLYVKWMITPYHELAMKVLRKSGKRPHRNEGYESALRKAHESLDSQD